MIAVVAGLVMEGWGCSSTIPLCVPKLGRCAISVLSRNKTWVLHRKCHFGSVWHSVSELRLFIKSPLKTHAWLSYSLCSFQLPSCQKGCLLFLCFCKWKSKLYLKEKKNSFQLEFWSSNSLVVCGRPWGDWSNWNFCIENHNNLNLYLIDSKKPVLWYAGKRLMSAMTNKITERENGICSILGLVKIKA